MLDHIIISVSDISTSKGFYEQALAPLRYQIVMEFGQGCGFGVMQKPDFFINQGGSVKPPVHIAFTARDRETVDAFYEAALAAGASLDEVAEGLALYRPVAGRLDMSGSNSLPRTASRYFNGVMPL